MGCSSDTRVIAGEGALGGVGLLVGLIDGGSLCIRGPITKIAAIPIPTMTCPITIFHNYLLCLSQTGFVKGLHGLPPPP